MKKANTPVAKRFIVIDDDPINNMICRLTIEMIDKTTEIKMFTNPAEGFDYIQDAYVVKNDPRSAIVLLDINMPVMTGWEFLDRFDGIPAEYKKRLAIYILSSSVDDRDRERSYANKNVKDFLVKPLITDVVLKIVGG